jgi:DNA-binding NarL/FixJ family response regulator
VHAVNSRVACGDRTDLTEREPEIAQFAAHGPSDREIAEQLVISPRTVDTHLHRCSTELNIDGRVGRRDLTR